MFFDRVSKFSRIINISNVDIRTKDRPEANMTVSADCVATTFVLLDQAAVSAAKAKAAAAAAAAKPPAPAAPK
jgi:Tfp pilus assembly protein PilO